MQESSMLKASALEEQFRKWREARGSQPMTECRTVKVNGQEVVVLHRPKRPTPA